MSNAALAIGLGLATLFGIVIDRVIEDLPAPEPSHACPMLEVAVDSTVGIGLALTDRLHLGVVYTGS